MKNIFVCLFFILSNISAFAQQCPSEKVCVIKEIRPSFQGGGVLLDEVCVLVQNSDSKDYFYLLCNAYKTGQNPDPQIDKAKALARAAEKQGICNFLDY